MAEQFWKWVAGRNARAVCLFMSALFVAAVLVVLSNDPVAAEHDYMPPDPAADVADRIETFRIRRLTDAADPFVSAHLHRLEADRLRRDEEARRLAEQERLRREAEAARAAAERAAAEKAAAEKAAAEKAARLAAQKAAADKAAAEAAAAAAAKPKPTPPAPKPAPKPKPKPAPKPRPIVLTYRGMMKQTDGEIVAVLFEEKSRAESVLSAGEAIAGCKVKTIGRDNVILTRDDGTELVLQVNVPMKIGQ